MKQDELFASFKVGAVGAVLSLVTNGVFFVSFSNLLVKTLVGFILWSILGAGLIFISKKFLPEVHQALFSNNAGGGGDSKGGQVDLTVGGEEEAEDAVPDFNVNVPDMDDIQFKEESDLGGSDTAPSGTLSVTSNPSYSADYKKKEEKYEFKQEPKVIAKAVRTIMKKDS